MLRICEHNLEKGDIKLEMLFLELFSIVLIKQQHDIKWTPQYFRFETGPLFFVDKCNYA